MTLSNISESSGGQGKVATAPLAVQIEVDIEPPPSGGLTDEKLEKLGLPTHHVHFTAAAAAAAEQQQVMKPILSNAVSRN